MGRRRTETEGRRERGQEVKIGERRVESEKKVRNESHCEKRKFPSQDRNLGLGLLNQKDRRFLNQMMHIRMQMKRRSQKSWRGRLQLDGVELGRKGIDRNPGQGVLLERMTSLRNYCQSLRRTRVQRKLEKTKFEECFLPNQRTSKQCPSFQRRNPKEATIHTSQTLNRKESRNQPLSTESIRRKSLCQLTWFQEDPSQDLSSTSKTSRIQSNK